MAKVKVLNHNSIIKRLLLLFICCFLTPSMSYSEDLSLESISVRGSFSEATVLGNDAPEKFEVYDLSANFTLPWKKDDSVLGLNISTGLMASAGIFSAEDTDAILVSLIPKVIIGSEDNRYTLDVGLGGALLSKQHFGTQDFGGSFQFALTSGITVPLYEKVSVGYRFMHYSDASIHGAGTTGADLHMLEFSYKF